MNYVVCEGADGTRWDVAAYSVEYAAFTHAELANRWCEEHGCWMYGGCAPKKNLFDKNMRFGVPGLHYFVEIRTTSFLSTGVDWESANVEI